MNTNMQDAKPGDRILLVSGPWRTPIYNEGVVARVLKATFTITLDGDDRGEHRTKYKLDSGRAFGQTRGYGNDYVVPATPEWIARRDAEIAEQTLKNKRQELISGVRRGTLECLTDDELRAIHVILDAAKKREAERR